MSFMECQSSRPVPYTRDHLADLPAGSAIFSTRPEDLLPCCCLISFPFHRLRLLAILSCFADVDGLRCR